MAANGEISSDLAIAQFESFARRMPSYYISVIAMMAASAYVFYPLAPLWLSCVIPAAAIVLSSVRGLWWFRHRNDKLSGAEAKYHLTRATRIFIVTVCLVVCMDIRLFFYGDPHARYFMLFQLMASLMCGFYCLMQLRFASIVMAFIVMIPCCALMRSMHQTGTTAAAVNLLLTGGVMISAMLGYQQDFVTLVKSKAIAQGLSEENLRLAHLDMLTGLPNRRHFFDVHDKMLLSSGEPGDTATAVAILDLDGFKPINDTYGHRTGDKVLSEIAARLSLASPDVKHLCRVGGDEFAFVTVAVVDSRHLIDLGNALIDIVSQPFQIGGRNTSVSCSVGFAVSAGADFNLDVLYEKADYALYHAKRSGRRQAVIFSEEHETQIREQALVEQALRSAEFDAEFYPVFQPIVDARTGQTIAFECLARWNSAMLGNVSPGVFIPIAERTGLITTLTPVLLRKALEVATTWPQDVHLSFNVSAHDVASLGATLQLIDILHLSGIDPRRIAIELTETSLLQNFFQTSAHLAMIRATGVKIALDDFGTGHSTLTHLHELPLDKIKVDRSFIYDIHNNPASKNIVKSLIALCRDMSIGCIIEGVETHDQLAMLQSFDANIIQGYLFGKPMPADSIANFLNGTPSARAKSLPGKHPSDTVKPGPYAVAERLQSV